MTSVRSVKDLFIAVFDDCPHGLRVFRLIFFFNRNSVGVRVVSFRSIYCSLWGHCPHSTHVFKLSLNQLTGTVQFLKTFLLMTQDDVT